VAARRVVIVIGSPRREGNSSVLAYRLADGVRSAGADAKVFRLHDMNIAPCNACDACLEEDSGRCVIDDDMQVLHSELRRADALAIASPIYLFTVSAQTKLFLDRCRPLWQPHDNVFRGMPVGVLLAYADPDPFISGAINAIRMMQDTCAYIGAHLVGTVYGSASEPGEISRSQEVMDRAYGLGTLLGTPRANC